MCTARSQALARVGVKAMGHASTLIESAIKALLGRIAVTRYALAVAARIRYEMKKHVDDRLDGMAMNAELRYTTLTENSEEREIVLEIGVFERKMTHDLQFSFLLT